VIETRATKYTCCHCGALYDVRVRTDSKIDYHVAVCSFCGDVMAEWRGKARRYRKRKNPRDATQLAKNAAGIAAGSAALNARSRGGL
jgi:hypothetical protein